MVPFSSQDSSFCMWSCCNWLQIWRKVSRNSAFDSWVWTSLLLFNDLYTESNIWAAWNMPLFNLEQDILSRAQFNHFFCCFCFQCYLLYLFQDTASLTLTSASLPSFETLLCTVSHWCPTMPLIQILSSILRAPLSHHPPATCSPSHLTASATPTHQKALLDLEVPISSWVRMSFGTLWHSEAFEVGWQF